jgi:hypothetical protein
MALGAVSAVDPRISSGAAGRAEIAVFALLAACCAVVYLDIAGVALDDMYIYFRVARNWADGSGPVFNPHDHLFVTTSPAWLALLTAALLLVPAIDILTVAQALFTALLLGASLFLFLILRPRFPVAAALAPVAVFFAPAMPSLCGHDTALALCTGLALIWCAQQRRLGAAAVAAALFYLARGEGAAFGLAVLLYLVIAPDRSVAGMRRRLRAAWPGLVLAGALVGAWHVYYFSTFGGIFPDTLQAKMLQGHSRSFSKVHPYFYRHYLAAFSVVAVPVIVWGLYLCLRRVPLLFAWPVIHLAALYAVGVAYYHWYYYPVELVLLVAGALVIDQIVHTVRRRAGLAQRPIGLPSLALAAVALAGLVKPVAYAAVNGAPDVYRRVLAGAAIWPHGSDVRRETYREIARWINDAITGARRPTVLSVEVGLFGFWLPRVDLYDVVGLTYPARAVADLHDWPRIAARLQPDLIVYSAAALPETLDFGPVEGGGALRYRRVYVPRAGLPDIAVYCRDGAVAVTCAAP